MHGWIYAIADGLLRDLGMTVSALAELETRRAQAVAEMRVA